MILHADKEGFLEGIKIDDSLPATVVEEDLWVELNGKVLPFEGANRAIGTLVLNFESEEGMNKAMDDISSWLKVVVR